MKLSRTPALEDQTSDSSANGACSLFLEEICRVFRSLDRIQPDAVSAM